MSLREITIDEDLIRKLAEVQVEDEGKRQERNPRKDSSASGLSDSTNTSSTYNVGKSHYSSSD